MLSLRCLVNIHIEVSHRQKDGSGIERSMGWRFKKIWQSSVYKCKAIKLDEITKGISVDRRAEVLGLSLEALWHYEKSRTFYPSFNQR